MISLPEELRYESSRFGETTTDGLAPVDSTLTISSRWSGGLGRKLDYDGPEESAEDLYHCLLYILAALAVKMWLHAMVAFRLRPMHIVSHDSR